MVALAPAPVHERPVLLACGPRDLHTLGLDALAALLVHGGRGCRSSVRDTRSGRSSRPPSPPTAAAVVVVSHLATQRRPAVEALRAVAAIGCPVFYAGNAFLFPGGRSDVPGHVSR
jgi:hypothetical protein